MVGFPPNLKKTWDLPRSPLFTQFLVSLQDVDCLYLTKEELEVRVGLLRQQLEFLKCIYAEVRAPGPSCSLLWGFLSGCVISRCFRGMSPRAPSVTRLICPVVHVYTAWAGPPQYLTMAISIVSAFCVPVSHKKK